MPGFRMTNTDLQCFRDIADYGLMETNAIHCRHFPSYNLRSVQKRLRLFAENDFTRQNCLAVAYQLGVAKSAGGAMPIWHSLSSNGIEAVTGLTATTSLRVQRPELSPFTLHHRSRIVTVRLAVDESAASLKIAAPQWVMEQDINPEASQKLPPNQRRFLYHRFDRNGHKSTCLPDIASVIVSPAGHPVLGLWEIDLKTEGHAQFARKLPGYLAYLKTPRPWQPYFPDLVDPTVRIFCVCLGPKRLTNLIKTVKSSPIAKYFRITTFDDLTVPRTLNDKIWADTNGDRHAFLASPSTSP